MENQTFRMWCAVATSKIGFPPDRKVVREELQQHMDDRYDALIEKGHSPEEATAMTVEAMGDARELAPQLAAIHRPFWGYLLRISRIALVIAVCLCVVSVWNYFAALDLGVRRYRDFELFDAASYGGDTGRALHHLSRPGTTFSSDGNTFKLTDAVIFTETVADGTEMTRLYFRIQQRSLLPWTEQEDYFGLFPAHNNIGAYLYAVDSLGNTYSSYQPYTEGSNHIVPSGGQTGIFTYTHECWINDFQGKDAKWVDICYSRDGRDFRLRIVLNGGGAE